MREAIPIDKERESPILRIFFLTVSNQELLYFPITPELEI